MDDRYGSDVLAAGWKQRGKPVIPKVPVERDLVVEVVDDGFCGAIVKASQREVQLEDRVGRKRIFPLGHGFLIDGKPVELMRPVPASTRKPSQRTASGSFVAQDARARTALASRILVEGRHDAELVEKVWGADLRVEGVVVEYLQGIDVLDEMLEKEPPSAKRRYGILVDHLVPGSKETRMVREFMKGPHGRFMKFVGHPYVDVWQTVTPKAMGITAWPEIPRGIEWKVGICEAFGWQHETQADIAAAWQRILARVTTFRDLEPALIGRVEELIDYVTSPG